MSMERLDDETERMMMNLAKKLGGRWSQLTSGKLVVMLDIEQSRTLVKKIKELEKAKNA